MREVIDHLTGRKTSAYIVIAFEAAGGPSIGRSVLRRAWGVLQTIWTTTIVGLAVIVGAVHGWENHGLIGAAALGLCGLVIGGFLSSPRILLQILA
jgi:hypothetical protein